MNKTDYHGISMILVDEDEAVRTDWRTVEDACLVRVEHPSPEATTALRGAGFLVKPQFVTWLTPVGETEQDYLAGLKSTERQRIRRARERFTDEGGEMTTGPLTEDWWSEFLSVYDTAIESMDYGVNVAREQTDGLLAAREDHVVVDARVEGRLVGGCVARIDRPQARLVMRFSGVDAAWRESSLARVMYLRMMQEAREADLGTFGLGSDRNLYGHIAKPGLPHFKKTMGLTPHASHLVGAGIGYDQADLVLSTQQLTDPTLLFGYADDPGEDTLTVVGYGTRADDLKKLQSLSTHPVELRTPLLDCHDSVAHHLGVSR